MSKVYDIAAYVWPAYTGKENRARIFWEEGYGEWQTVKNAVPKYPGHSWPRKPLWGYVDEADPYVMGMEIDAASGHGVNVFIYDWYWYDGRPFLEQCLNDGFLKAKNNSKMKFYLMWANHDANYLWDIRNSSVKGVGDTVIWSGKVTKDEFKKIGLRWIEKYFLLDNYYRIDNKPVLSIYDLANFINGVGGYENAKECLEWLNGEAVKKGLCGIHYQHEKRGDNRLIDVTGVDGSNLSIKPDSDFIENLGFNSLTNYQYVQFLDINRDYGEIIEDAKKEWEKINKDFKIPYFPNVSLGWDNNIRHKERKNWVTTGNTPDKVEKVLKYAKEYADKYNSVPLIVINSWNEWTESSYLQPDDLYGYGYLEAVKKVFKND